MVHLLAFDGKEDDRRQGKLGRILHDFSKWAIRKAVDRIHNKMLPVIEYKKKTGWHKEHIKAIEEGWNWVISLDELPINLGIGGFKGANDINRKLYMQLRDIFLVHLDEDTHYDMRMLVLLKWIHEHWDRIEEAANASYNLMNFHEIYKDLLALSEPLPLDDGKEEKEIDYPEFEARLLRRAGEKHGMGNDG